MPLAGLRARLRDIKHPHRISGSPNASHGDNERREQHIIRNQTTSEVPISMPAPFVPISTPALPPFYGASPPRSSSASQPVFSTASGLGSAAMACVQAVVNEKHVAKLGKCRPFLQQLPELMSDGEDDPSSPEKDMRKLEPRQQQTTEAFNNRRILTRNSYDAASSRMPCLSLADSFRRIPQPMALYPPPMPARVRAVLPPKYFMSVSSVGGIPHSKCTPRTQRHSALRVGGDVICFGGVRSDGEYESQVTVWNLYKQEWSHLSGAVLSPREAHSAVAVGHHMYIYGGYGPAGLDRELHNLGDTTKSSGSGYFNDVVEVDLTTGVSVEVKCKGHNQDYRAAHTAVTYRRPRALPENSSALSLHNLVNSAPVCEDLPADDHPDLAAGGWEMLVFGGWRLNLDERLGDPTRRRLDRSLACVEAPRNDVSVLDLSCLRWYLLPCSGCLPAPRVWHTAVVYGRRYMVVFGGYGCQQSLQDSRLHPCVATVPPLRRQQTMPVKACRENAFLDSECFSDLHVLDMERAHWSEIRDCSGRIPQPRYGHAAALVDDVMLIFGGRGVRGNYLATMHSFNFSTHTWRDIVWPSSPLQARAHHSFTFLHFLATPTGTNLLCLLTGGRVQSDKDDGALPGRQYHTPSGGPCASPVLLCLAATSQTQPPSPTQA